MDVFFSALSHYFQLLKRYFKVCAVGGVGMIVQLVFFNILRIHLHPAYANALSVEFSIVSNFLLNNYFSFRDSRLSIDSKLHHWIKKFLLFNFFSLGSLLIQTVIMLIGVDLWGRGIILENGLIIVGIGLGSIYNYKMYRHFVWR